MFHRIDLIKQKSADSLVDDRSIDDAASSPSNCDCFTMQYSTCEHSNRRYSESFFVAEVSSFGGLKCSLSYALNATEIRTTKPKR